MGEALMVLGALAIIVPPQRRQSVNGLFYCPGCKDWFIRNAFYKNRLTTLGITSKCKKCLDRYRKPKTLFVEVSVEKDADINFTPIIEGRLAKGTWIKAIRMALELKRDESILVKVPKNHALWINAPASLMQIAYKLGILINVTRAENGIVIKFLKKRKLRIRNGEASK